MQRISTSLSAETVSSNSFKKLKEFFVENVYKSKSSAKKKVIRYVLTCLIRLIIAATFLLLSSLFAFGVGHHYFIAKTLQSNGQEARVLVVEKVEPQRAISAGSRRFYRLKFADGRQIKHYSQANYPVGEYIDILFFPDSLTIIQFSGFSDKLSGLSVSHAIAHGTKADSLVKLYFSSIKNNFSDYGITHFICAVVLAYCSIRILFPFLFERDNEKRN